MTKRKSPEDLESLRCLGAKDLCSSGHRSRPYRMGYVRREIDARPVIAIVNMLPKPGCSRGGYVKTDAQQMRQAPETCGRSFRPSPEPKFH